MGSKLVFFFQCVLKNYKQEPLCRNAPSMHSSSGLAGCAALKRASGGIKVLCLALRPIYKSMRAGSNLHSFLSPTRCSVSSSRLLIICGWMGWLVTGSCFPLNRQLVPLKLTLSLTCMLHRRIFALGTSSWLSMPPSKLSGSEMCLMHKFPELFQLFANISPNNLGLWSGWG